MVAKRPVRERFDEKVDRSGECHEWTGCVMPNGYGQIRHKGKTAYAHRVAWELVNGTIPDGEYVLHRCDNRKCVNPDHLFLGSFYDNMDDMVAKGRQAKGERGHHAKLTEDQVREIRDMPGKQKEIAGKFGVTQSLVSKIQRRRIWRYIDDIV